MRGGSLYTGPTETGAGAAEGGKGGRRPYRERERERVRDRERAE